MFDGIGIGLFLGGGSGAVGGSHLLPGNTTVVALFGDSLEQHNGLGNNTSGSEEYSNWSRGYYNWTRLFTPCGRWDNWWDPTISNKFFQGQNQGISGNTTTQMLGRTSDIFGLTNLAVVVCGGGTNDINESDPTATIESNLRSIYNQIIAAGAKVIIMTVPPRPVSGANSWPSGGTKRLAWFALCSWMQAQADADPSNIKIVRRDLICSLNDTDRTPKPGYLQSDNVHLTPLAGYHIAKDSGGLCEQLSGWVAPFTDWPAAVVSGDLSPFPSMSGTGGTASTGSTGTVATNAVLVRSSGSTGVTAVASKEDVNGINCQKIVFTRDGSGSIATFTIGKSGTITTGLPSTGDWLRGYTLFKADASDSWQGISLRNREQPSAGSNMDGQSLRIDTGLNWADADLSDDGDLLWGTTPPWKWRTSGTGIIWNTTITIDNTNAGTNTVWIARMQLLPIDNPENSLGFGVTQATWGDGTELSWGNGTLTTWSA